MLVRSPKEFRRGFYALERLNQGKKEGFYTLEGILCIGMSLNAF